MRLKTNYQKLNPYFKEFADMYGAEAEKRGKKDTVIQGDIRSAASFLMYMQNSNADTLAKINQNMVVSYFTDENGYPDKSYGLKKTIAFIFRTCSTVYPECDHILSYLPKLKKRRKNIPYLTDGEIVAIKKTLTDSTLLSLRDKAIGLLALETGLRSCDIAGLKLSSIDWEKDLISITQQKTNYPLEIPLPTRCGNAIYDYIQNERPQTNIPEIFLRAHLPYERLKCLIGIAAKIARIAGIRQNPGDRRGFHLYRHHLASALLDNNISGAVISKTLGHTAPGSLEAYLGTDFVHLKEYALSIEDFPVDFGGI